MKSKGRLLFVSYAEFPPFKGGIASYVTNIIDALHESYDLYAVGPFTKKTYVEDRRVLTVYRPRLTRLPLLTFGIGNLTTIFLILLIRPNVIFITDIISLDLCRLLFFLNQTLFPGIKIHYCIYGTEILDFSSQKSKQVSSIINKSVNSVIAISKYTQKLLSQYLEIQIPIALVYPTVSCDFLNHKYLLQDTNDQFSSFHLANKTYVLSIGRLVKRKGFDKVIMALKQIPDVHYVIIGNGPEKESLHRLAVDSNLAERVHIADSVTDEEKKYILEHCLFYIQPSVESTEQHHRVEGFGIAVLEAFSMKKTAIVTSHGGMPEIVTSTNGVLVSPNVQEIATAIQSLIHSNSRQEKERNAYDTFVNQFSPERFKQQLHEVVEI